MPHLSNKKIIECLGTDKFSVHRVGLNCYMVTFHYATNFRWRGEICGQAMREKAIGSLEELKDLLYYEIETLKRRQDALDKCDNKE